MSDRYLFRYVLRNRHTGVLHLKEYYLDKIEESGLKGLFDIENYIVIHRPRFTGLTDKNGKMIFEGDVVTSDFHNKSKLMVVFEFAAFKLAFIHDNSFAFSPSKSILGGLEIIGSIHD